MNATHMERWIATQWDESIVPCLTEYIGIPCKSPHFDGQWQSNGHLDRAVALAKQWCERQAIPGLIIEVIRLPGRTPLLWFEVSGNADRTVLLYGHLDKQPEMVGWRNGFGPWTPAMEDDKLYGRGGADDGYAVFASITAIRALRLQGLPHARCVGLIECCEESGSYDLPFYLEALSARIGQVDFVIGLDSGCGNYDQLWVTTSLRGLAAGTLSVEVLREGVHSGDASGIVPSSFRIARQLLDRLDDPRSGKVLPGEFHCEIPVERIAQARLAGEVLGNSIVRRFPMVDGMQPMTEEPQRAVLARTWEPYLSVVGADGLPAIRDAGNVLRPRTALKLSLRLPPLIDGTQATRDLNRILEANPPYGARISFDVDQGATGWNAPATASWLAEALNNASHALYSKPAVMMGEGGTIPFMAMLGKQYPRAQFLITGVLGPASNAHGPNEFLHIPYAKKLTACVAQVLAAHHQSAMGLA